MAAPSSAHTKPSRTASTAPPTHANSACGPPIALITRELTTNGPIPTISIMFRATASFRPRPRSSPPRSSPARPAPPPGWEASFLSGVVTQPLEGADFLRSHRAAENSKCPASHLMDADCTGLAAAPLAGDPVPPGAPCKTAFRAAVSATAQNEYTAPTPAAAFMSRATLVAFAFAICSVLLLGPPARGAKLDLPPSAHVVLDQIYSGDLASALDGAHRLEQENPAQPLGYMLEAEALWWRIWCTSAEFKYGMTYPRRRAKLNADQHYFDLAAKVSSLAASQ